MVTWMQLYTSCQNPGFKLQSWLHGHHFESFVVIPLAMCMSCQFILSGFPCFYSIILFPGDDLFALNFRVQSVFFPIHSLVTFIFLRAPLGSTLKAVWRKGRIAINSYCTSTIGPPKQLNQHMQELHLPI